MNSAYGITPQLLERYDVYELWVAVSPLIACQSAYDDETWVTTMQLAGVQNVAGQRITDTESTMTGTLSTHPPLALRVILKTDENGLHTCTEFGLTETIG